MVFRPQTFDEFMESERAEEQRDGEASGGERWEAAVAPIARADAEVWGRGVRTGRPLEKEIRTLELGIARLGVMLEDEMADARDVALPLSRLVRALSMALRTQHAIARQTEDAVDAAIRRALKEVERSNER